MLLTTLTLVILGSQPTISHSLLNMAQETEDFRTLLLNNDLFVDKSLLIEEFLGHIENYTIPVLVRPEGWGKSINADMLRRFFEIEVDEKGERLPKEKLTNDKLFLGGGVIDSNNNVKKLNPLKIANSPKALEHLGKNPVILVKMKNATGHSPEEIEKNIKSCIIEAFKSHSYLLHSSKITDKEILSNYFNGVMNLTQFKWSIFFLSQKLYEHFDRKVHIIIDDYDVPNINSHLSFGRNPLKLNKLMILIKHTYEAAFKHNPYRGIGLVTGVLTAVKTPIFVLPKDPKHYIAQKKSPFVLPKDPIHYIARKKPPFIEHYGLIREEVQEILTKVSINLNLGQIQSWYGGYSVFGPQEFFNTRSVMRCLANNGTLQYYGSGSNITTLVDRILSSNDNQNQIQTVIRRGSLPNYYFSFANAEAITWVNTLPEFRVLFLAGYLRADPTRPFGNTTIPNEEIRHFFETKVLHWVNRKFCTDPDRFRSFVGQILNGEIYQFRKSLEKYLRVAHNFYPLQEAKRENPLMIFYGGLMIAIKSALSETHLELLPEQGIDKTNYMILLPRQGQNDVAIVITYKIIDREENLTSVAKAGLWEIYTRQYGEQWKIYPHIRKLILISMTFYYEKVELQCSIEKL